MSVLKTVQITANKPRTPGIYFTEPNTIEELVSEYEYTIDPANCPLMCACKGNKAEIVRYLKNPDTLNDRGIEMYIPFRGGEHIEAAKVTAFQIGTTDLVLMEVPDFTPSSQKITRQVLLIVAEVRKGLIAPKTFNRLQKE